jgi:ankyrin repeat protein
VSRYHIALEPAHVILAQACVSVLLQSHDHDEQDDVEKNAPLAQYAAEYWVRHAQCEDVVSRIKGMEYLFDADKPYFAAWCKLHDIDHDSPDSVFCYFTFASRKSAGTPLYYAALCGFRNIAEQLIVKHPQHVNATGGWYRTPAVAALAGRHFELAQVLHRSGSSVDPRGFQGRSPLHSAAVCEDLEMIQILLDYGIDVNVGNEFGSTPLALYDFEDPRVVRLLLDNGADPNARSQNRTTQLHRASRSGRIEIVRILVEHGASAEIKNWDGRTPLEIASGKQHDEIVKLLSEHLAK